MPSADLFLRVDAFGSDALQLRVQIQNDSADPDGLRLDAAIDGTAGAMASPTGITPQRIGLRVYVDGTLVPELAACKVTISRKQNLQTWSFTVPIHSGADGDAGDWDGNGTGLCKRSIDIRGVYKTTTGYHEVSLITNGIADNETREGQDGALVTYEGVDAGGRWDREAIDFILPPGSGLPRERVISIAAARAGVEDISLEHSETAMMHEFQLADASFLEPCQEIADVEGRVIQWDRSGFMVWPRYGSGALVPSTSRWTFTERNLVKGSLRLSQPGELITEITVEGNTQALVGPCGDVTSRLVITTSSLNGPIAPLYAQSAGSSYAVNPQPSPLTSAITVKVETFDTTRRCGVIVYEKRTVQEFYNPEVSRYEWNETTDSWDTLGSVYTDDNTDDDSPAFRYPKEQWTTTEIDETWTYWMRQGFEGPIADVIPYKPAYLDMFYGLSAPRGWDGLTSGTGWYGLYDPLKFDGLLIGTLTKAQRWYGVRQYVKQRAITAYPLDSWNDVEPSNGWEVLGGKESIVTGAEQFLESEQLVTIYGTNGNGYQTNEDEYRFGYMATKGSPYLYGDEPERADIAETLRFTGATYRQYIGVGEQSHDEVETETDYSDRTVRSVQSTGLDSYLPPADRIPDSGPSSDTDVYADTAERDELYERAYLTESVPVSVTVTDDSLEQCSTRGVHKVTSPYIENDDEADWLARWLIDEAAAGVFDCELAGANFFLQPGDWCSSITVGSLGIQAAPGRVEEVTWDWKAGQVLNTQATILLYP